MKKSLSLALSALVLVACSSTKQYVPTATIDKLQPGNALIRVERKNEFVGGGRSIEVIDNGVKIGQLSPGKSIAWQRPAGPMEINLVPAALAVKTLTPIKIDTAAGKTYDFTSFWSWDENSFVIKPK